MSDDWVFTGDNNGCVIQWQFSKDKQKIKPRLLFYKKGAGKITALTTAELTKSPPTSSPSPTSQSDNSPLLVLCVSSDDGCLSVWSMEGECFSSSFVIPYQANSMLPFSCHSQSCLILSSNYHPYIYIYSLPQLIPLMILGDERDPSGIISLSLIIKKAKRDSIIEQRSMILSISRNGQINVWDVNNKLRKHSEKGILYSTFFSFSTFQSANFSLISETSETSKSPLILRAFSHIINSPLIFLLTETSLELISTASLNWLQSIKLTQENFPLLTTNSNDSVINIKAIHNDIHPAASASSSSFSYEEHLLLTFTSRRSFILIIRYNYLKRRGQTGSNSLNEECHAELIIDSVMNLDQMINSTTKINDENNNNSDNEKNEKNLALNIFIEPNEKTIVIGSNHGQLTIIKTNIEQQLRSNKNYNDNNDNHKSQLLTFPNIIQSNVSDAFINKSGQSLLPSSPSSLLLSPSSSPHVTCTLSLTTRELPFYYLAAGYSNGLLTIQSLNTNYNQNHSCFIHNSSITCMLSYYDSLVNEWFLLTGSSDSTVSIYDLKHQRIRTKFYCSSPIKSLIQAESPLLPSTTSKSLLSFTRDLNSSSSNDRNNLLFSSLIFIICENLSIKIFNLLDYSLKLSLYGHKSSPIAIHYTNKSIELDEIGVTCEDGSIYFWSMTGELLRVIEKNNNTEKSPLVIAAERGWLKFDSLSQINSLCLQVTIEIMTAHFNSQLSQISSPINTSSNSNNLVNGKKNNRKSKTRDSIENSSTNSSTQSAFSFLSYSPFILSALSALSAKPPSSLPSLLEANEINEEIRSSQLEFITLLATLFPTTNNNSNNDNSSSPSSGESKRNRHSINKDDLGEISRARYRLLIESIKDDARQFEQSINNNNSNNYDDDDDDEEISPLTESWRFASRSSSHITKFSSFISFDLDSFCSQLQQRYVKYHDDVNDADDEDEEISNNNDEINDKNDRLNDSDLRFLLSLIFDWDGQGSTELIMRDRLFLPTPVNNRGYFLSSYENRAISLSFPATSFGHRRWQIGSLWSANYSLIITAVCQSIISVSTSLNQSTIFNQLLLYYHQALPVSHKNYQSPAIPALVMAAFSERDSVLCAARVLLQQSLDSLTPEQLTELSIKWGNYYDFPIPIEPVFAHDRAKLDEKDENQVTEKRDSFTSSINDSLINNNSNNNNNEIIPVDDCELQVCMVLTLIGLIEMNQRKRNKRAAILQAYYHNYHNNQNSQSKTNKASNGRHDNGDSNSNNNLKYSPSLSSSSISSSLLSNSYPSSLSSPPAHNSSSSTLTEFEAKSQYLTFTLLRAIAAPVIANNSHSIMLTSLACDLLYKSINYLRVHITQPIPLIRRLLALSLSSDKLLRQSAHRTLIESGKVAPALFIECMAKESSNIRNDSDVRQSAIASLVTLIKTHSQALAKVLPSAVSACIKCLDPSQQSQRKLLLHSATSALYTMVQNYPATSFHQQSQRFAVGTGISQHCVIIIYDLRTATVWRLLEGHGSEINAVTFSGDDEGGRLISYSALESPSPSIRIWNTEISGGFLSGLIGMSGKCIKIIRFDRVDYSIMNSMIRKMEMEKIIKLAMQENEKQKRKENFIQIKETENENISNNQIIDNNHYNHNKNNLSVSTNDININNSSGYDSPSLSPRRAFSPSLTSFDSPLSLPRTTLTNNNEKITGGININNNFNGRPSSTSLAIPINQTLRKIPPPLLNNQRLSSQSSQISQQHQSSASSSMIATPSPNFSSPSISSSLPSTKFEFTPDFRDSPQLSSNHQTRTSTPPLLYLDENDETINSSSIGLTLSPSLQSTISDGSVTNQVRVSLLSRMLSIQLQWLNEKEIRLTREDGSSSVINIT